MPVDPFGYDNSYDSYRPSYEPLSVVDLISQGIEVAGDVARGAWGDYRYPDDPRYRPNVTVYPQPAPGPAPQPGPAPTPTLQPGTQPKDSVTFSNTTLMLLVGGALLFFLGTKKGR